MNYLRKRSLIAIKLATGIRENITDEEAFEIVKKARERGDAEVLKKLVKYWCDLPENMDDVEDIDAWVKY